MKQPFHEALRKFAFQDGALSDLTTLDCRQTPGFFTKKGETKGKAAGQKRLQRDVERLAKLQELLFANAQAAELRRSVLLVMQGMDTSGKGSTITHVVGSMNPQGVHQVGFKKPTEEELRHDFLWRIRRETPKHGEIGVFDRSHYEDVLIHRVEELTPPSRLERRYGSIRQFEKELVSNGTIVVKVLLHISREEQYERLSKRLDNPEKHWKFTPSDVDAREKWDEYMEAHQLALEETDKPEAPWFVIPADRKWYARLAVQQLLIETLESLELSWPEATFDIEEQRKRLEASR
ncbi:hypothetical protein GCM10023190_09080 [Enteractinococcus fodinae]|uniref:PPK2 family polyphosphate:nucleotide phosphotransferase n=1 Tax=Enteractinococcus fodinae TaxID=684663 RepID=A0ABU2AZN7_9MICC|nr:PPK2 family polyphosphate kinase [Enteractinococcus fodinae]MDR7346616.1 PPK2 family polyphosphate:nucleotide phosphotransferase [Enteractinococcus fodinae]